MSRILRVTTGLSLWVAYLELANGAAPDSTYDAAGGGCVLAECADGCSLSIDSSLLRNCNAPSSRGGGVAFFGSGVSFSSGSGWLAVQDSQFVACSAAQGGGLFAAGGTVMLNNTNFTANVASSDSGSGMLMGIALDELFDPVGGGAALLNVTGSIAGCVFSRNAAMGMGLVLVVNPELPQARGGGLFVATRSDAASFIISEHI
jgi:hypothetical protein